MVRRAETTPVGEVERLYTFRDEREVRKYLRRYPFLVPLLEEAYGEIERCFGENPKVVLEVHIDPEIPNYRTLFALVQTELGAEEARAKLDCVDDSWWLEQPHRALVAMCFSLEFV